MSHLNMGFLKSYIPFKYSLYSSDKTFPMNLTFPINQDSQQNYHNTLTSCKSLAQSWIGTMFSREYNGGHHNRYNQYIQEKSEISYLIVTLILYLRFIISITVFI